MKIGIYFGLALLVFPVLCIAQASAGSAVPPASNSDPNAPVMKFDTTGHDFGTMQQGGNGTWLFVFTNKGKEPLIIKDARGSCGCTVPQWPHHPVDPGANDTIKVTYDTHRLGPFSKSVTITSNSKESPDMLFIKGRITPKPTVPPFTGIDNNNGAPYSANPDDN